MTHRAADIEQKLIDRVATFRTDPLGFVIFAFPWGEAGTELAAAGGPWGWQRELLDELGRKLRQGHDLGKLVPILMARASGHGIGKSTLVGWVILWALSTMADTRIVVTANTATQLSTKTWPELIKWLRLAINRHWFRATATSLYSADETHERLWRADAIPWSETNTEAFAGLHNAGKRVVMIFDEASAIHDQIWEVSEGALTDADTEVIWLVFGNPTRNTGRFRECFGKHRHRWSCAQIDSRDVDGTNKEQIAQWIKDYGEDSDFVRVRVRGVFPRAGSMQFISSELAEAAMLEERDPPVTLQDPLVMGVDVARYGDDASVICIRRGRDARTIEWERMRGRSTMDLVALVVRLKNEYKPDAIFVDGDGLGGPVIDRLRELKVECWDINQGQRQGRSRQRGRGEGDSLCQQACRDVGHDARVAGARRHPVTSRSAHGPDRARVRLHHPGRPRRPDPRAQGGYEKAWACLPRPCRRTGADLRLFRGSKRPHAPNVDPVTAPNRIRTLRRHVPERQPDSEPPSRL
jgi:hypothetical protein